MLRVLAKKESEHIDHEDHRADTIHARRNDRIPEPLGVGLLWTDWWHVLLHTDQDGDQDTRSDIPGDDGDGQGDDVTDAVRKVA